MLSSRTREFQQTCSWKYQQRVTSGIGLKARVRTIYYFMEYCFRYNLNRKSLRLTHSYSGISRYPCVVKNRVLMTNFLNKTTFCIWCNLIKNLDIEISNTQGKFSDWLVCVCACVRACGRGGWGDNTKIKVDSRKDKYWHRCCCRLNSVKMKTGWMVLRTQLDRSCCLLNAELFKRLQHILVCRLFIISQIEFDCLYGAASSSLTLRGVTHEMRWLESSLSGVKYFPVNETQ
jgi:hypothetical protein